MKGPISAGFALRVYWALKILLLSSLLQIPATLASGDFILKSYHGFDHRAALNRTANWILHFLNECHSGGEGPLIIAGNLNEKVISRIHNSAERAVTLFTEPETSIDQAYARARWTRDFHKKNFIRFQHTARIFLVVAKSQPVLRQVLKQLMTSRWWNFSGRFLILDEEPDKSGCRNARHYLSTAWLVGLLSTVYLCLGKDAQRLTLYSYNPFADQAPRPDWRTTATYNGSRNGHPWRLLRRELDWGSSEVEDISKKLNCGEIFFDKTSDLNGYPVRIEVLDYPPMLAIRRKGNISTPEKYSGEDAWLTQTLWEKLNVTVVEVPQPANWGIGFTDEHGVDHGIKSDVRNGRIDISVNQRYLLVSRNLGITYPHIQSEFCFLTKSKGDIPLWEKLVTSTNPSVVCLIIAILVSVIPLLVTLERGEYATMALDVIRVGLSAPLVKTPRRFTARFLVAGLLLVFGIVNGIFQGQIAALVTESRNYKDIDTLDELKKSEYTIHGFVAYENFITDPELRKKFVTSQVNEECFELAMADSPVACAGHCMILRGKSAEDSRLHVAEEPLTSSHVHYISRIDWPILGRVNQVIPRMVSAGLTRYWRQATLQRVTNKRVLVNGTTTSSEARPIRFNDLDAVLYLLLGGLLLSTLIFVVEVAFFRSEKE